MVVDDVVVVGVLQGKSGVLQHVVGLRLDFVGGTKGPRVGCSKAAAGLGVAGGAKGNVVAHADELFDEEMDDGLGAAVSRGRDALPERGSLKYPHGSPALESAAAVPHGGAGAVVTTHYTEWAMGL